ncbi:MAG: hypothetical protein IJG54_01265 [Bacteroidales bacterium]|jgi:hypothetical protein|nr:hypothetical protein [Bacteroidales bacterium]
MIVKVNKEEVRIFKGANAKHAILKYILKNKMDVSALDNIKVFDSKGHEIGDDSPLKEGQSITFKI